MMIAMYERKSRLTPRQQSRLIEHFVAGSTARAAAGITDGLIRVAVGLEDSADIQADLARGLDRLSR